MDLGVLLILLIAAAFAALVFCTIGLITGLLPPEIARPKRRIEKVSRNQRGFEVISSEDQTSARQR